jgi:hypothetical protein
VLVNDKLSGLKLDDASKLKRPDLLKVEEAFIDLAVGGIRGNPAVVLRSLI